MNITDLLEKLENVQGGPVQFTARCPAHQDTHNSLSIGIGKDNRILVRCHAGCSVSDIVENLSLTLVDLFQSPMEIQPRFFPSTAVASAHKKAISAHGEVDMQKRKFSKEIVYCYETIEGKAFFEVVRKVGENGNKSFLQRRYAEDGHYIYNLQNIEPVLYRLPAIAAAIKKNEPIYLCEGEKDVDRLIAAGLCATTAPMGAGKWRDSYTESLNAAPMVYIIPDNDAPGRAHGCTVSKALQSAGVPVAVVDLKAMMPDLPRKGDVSDVLDYLGDTAANEFAKNSIPYETFYTICKKRDLLEKELISSIESTSFYLKHDFFQELNEYQCKKKIQTGFDNLDAQLHGNMYPGLYVIGSISSLGKTAFCLQMADTMAQQGNDVLFFTLEMSRMEMIARSFSRLLFIDSGFQNSIGVNHILNGDIKADSLQRVVDTYRANVGERLCFAEGDFSVTVDTIIEKSLAYYEKTGNRPIIFVDYIQILQASVGRKGTDKQIMDDVILRLKRLSRDLDTPVIAVSSFNRQSYAEEVNMASFKESGAIEYSADFVLALQAQGISQTSQGILDEKKRAHIITNETKKVKQQLPRPLEAVTLKNRRGAAWDCFSLDFYPVQNFFAQSKR